MKSFDQVVSSMVNGIFCKKLIEKKGWSRNHCAYLVTDFITGGTKLSFKDFMESCE